MNLPKISSVFLTVTHDCCCRCPYCFVKQNPEYMRLETAKYAADWLWENREGRTPGINFFGGEPMLCYASIVKPLTEYVREKYPLYNLSITTNGVLLREDSLRFLSENNVGMLLSMDGGKETQDSQRPMSDGSSSFDRIDLGLIQHYYPTIGFRATITRASAAWFENFCFAMEHGFSTWFCMPNDFEEWDEDGIETLREHVQMFGDYFISSCRNGKRPIEFSSFERMFGAIRHINQAISLGIDRNLPRCMACNRCGTGGTYNAAIDPNGRIFACQDLSSFSDENSPFYLGDIFHGVSDERRNALIQWYDSTRCHGKNCSECRLNRICDGGCVANNYMANGDIRSVPKIHCEWYQMLLDEAIRVMNVLGSEGNQIFREVWNRYG